MFQKTSVEFFVARFRKLPFGRFSKNKNQCAPHGLFYNSVTFSSVPRSRLTSRIARKSMKVTRDHGATLRTHPQEVAG